MSFSFITLMRGQSVLDVLEEPDAPCGILPSPSSILQFSIRYVRVQPTARETCATQAFYYMRTTPHQSPDKSRKVVFDHENDGSLIESEMTVGNPTDVIILFAREGRIEAA